MKNSEIRYHYTSVEALINILATKRIRLTHCEDLDDPTEGRYLLDKLKNDLSQYEEIINVMTQSFFVGCFCAYSDNQHLWDNYGEVNIGFDYGAMKNDFRFISDSNGKEHDTSGTQFGVCHYTTCEDDVYNQVLEYSKSKLCCIDFNDIQSQQYAYLSCNGCFFLKPMGYKDEHESRIVSHLWRRTPYELENGKKYVEFHFTPDKITSVTISPSNKKNINHTRIQEFFEGLNEYMHVEIIDSSL